MAIRLLHLADLHLGATAGFARDQGETRRLDFLHAFDAAIDFALARDTRVDAVLICGDLFDSHLPPTPLVKHVQAGFERLQGENIPILLVPGLHDAYVYPDSIYRTATLPGAYLLLDPKKQQPRTFDLKGVQVHFYGSAWRVEGGTSLQGLSRQDLPGLHVALLHGDSETAGSAAPPAARFGLEALEATGMDYIAMGYHHNFRELQTGGPAVAWPGVLEATTIEDPEPRAFLVASFQMGKGKAPKVSLIRTPYAARPVINQVIDLTPLDVKGGTDGLAGYLMRFADPIAIMRLELVGVAEFIVDIERLRELLAHHFFSLDIEDKTSFSSSSLVSDIESEPTIRGLYTHQLLGTRADSEDESIVEKALKSFLKPCLEGELL